MVYAIASISFGGLCVDIDQQVEPTELSKKVELLRQLANAKRLQICAILSARELDVRTLAAEVGLSQSALSQHLARLRVSDMVKVRKHGQCRYYSCDRNDVVRMLETVHQIFGFRPNPVARHLEESDEASE
ncbi:MAG: ArsR/SmtB family transcription factor [Brucella sp.]